MKKSLFTTSLLFILTISVYCQADTISFWHVYLDNRLINEFLETTINPIIEIKTSDLNKNTFLTVEYFRDTPCSHCPTKLIIRNLKDSLILKIDGKGTTNKLELELDRLKVISAKAKEFSYRFYFEEKPFQDQYLFKLILK